MIDVEGLTQTYLQLLGRPVYTRPDTHDGYTFQDAEGLFHVPPRWMPKPRTVLDLGANIGLVSAHYKEVLWPEARVLCVEMDEGNCEMHTLNAPGYELVHAAVSDQSGVGFYDTTEETNRYHLDGVGGQEVELVTMPELISELGGRVDFCKMDIEGGEWRLFSAAETWADDVACLLVELHAPGVLEDAQAALRGAGYEVARSWLHPDALFCFKADMPKAWREW